MIQFTLVARKAPIIFAHVKLQIYINTHNTRISFPTIIILLGVANIKAYFHFARIHADLTGAFSFIADELYDLATVFVLWLTTSASS